MSVSCGKVEANSSRRGKVPQTQLSSTLMESGLDTGRGKYVTYINEEIDKFMTEYSEEYRAKYEEKMRMKIMTFISEDESRAIILAKAIHFGELFGIVNAGDHGVISVFEDYLNDSDFEEPLEGLRCRMEYEMDILYNDELCSTHRKRILPFWPITDVFHGSDRDDICASWKDDDSEEDALCCDEAIDRDFIKNDVFKSESDFDISSQKEDVVSSRYSYVSDFF
jgi:hypothetical protein